MIRLCVRRAILAVTRGKIGPAALVLVELMAHRLFPS
jgi:hypothetical protein